jgi:3'-phosphoadenosine 5'-phosphosulfate sulfotransferase (PAPS reductase)/FAD synthetase
MKSYLSFGGGVNSVALYLLMERLDMGFEAVFVNHGGDWPETYLYLDYFINSGRPVTVLKPDVRTVEKLHFDSIVDYCEHRQVVPSRSSRWCTDRFKIQPVRAYIERPCWMHLGIDAGESRRAILSSVDGIENRFLLIEHGLDRNACLRLIGESGLDAPPKSGCYICPFQSRSGYLHLRRTHPDLFCRAVKLEVAQNARTTADGRPWQPYHLAGVPLSALADQRQILLPGLPAYPPCQCGL